MFKPSGIQGYEHLLTLQKEPETVKRKLASDQDSSEETESTAEKKTKIEGESLNTLTDGVAAVSIDSSSKPNESSSKKPGKKPRKRNNKVAQQIQLLFVILILGKIYNWCLVASQSNAMSTKHKMGQLSNAFAVVSLFIEDLNIVSESCRVRIPLDF